MRRAAARRIGLPAVTLTVFVAGVILDAGNAVRINGHAGTQIGLTIAATTVGSLLLSRRPDVVIGWLFGFAGLGATLTYMSGEYVARALITSPGSLPWPKLPFLVGTWTWIVSIALLAVFAVLLFPDGRLPSKRWRPVAWLGAAGLAASVAGQVALGLMSSVDELPSEHVVGYEALARFPGSTPSPPDVWFADAHAVGLGIELELLAARRVVTSFAATSPGPFLSVNLCTAALSGEHLDDVLELCDPSCTVVELTEGRPEKGELAVIDRDRLRRRGIRLAVDDLGAGFAGLTRLIELEPEIVKLDRFLTMGISTDPRRSALAAATRHFCSAVDVDLIAEGVETGSDRDALLDLEVPFAQGYLFGRPAPPPMGSPG